jgi:uncharacterized protein YdhG (YjbR/CyaY superfamily)
MTVGKYLAGLPKPQRVVLLKLRSQIRAAAPDAVEGISYGMPVFRLHGPLVYFGAFKKHCSFFPGSAIVGSYKKELKRYETAKGTIRFEVDKPLPATLVRRIVKDRIKENGQRRAQRDRR